MKYKYILSLKVWQLFSQPMVHYTDSLKMDNYVLQINFLNNFELHNLFCFCAIQDHTLINLPTTESPMATLLTPDPVCVTIPATSYPTMYLLRGHFLYTSERTWINNKCFCSFSFLINFIEPFQHVYLLNICLEYTKVEAKAK